MNKEIGSEFWETPLVDDDNGLFPADIHWLVSGRAAIAHVLDDLLKKNPSASSAALPSWCCGSMIEPFFQRGFKLTFYPVSFMRKSGLKRDFSLAMGCDVLLVMSYFGFEEPEYPSDYSGVVINDITHSVLNRDVWLGDYVVGSLRKWMGISTGGYAWSRDGFVAEAPTGRLGEFEKLRRCAFVEKQKYMEQDGEKEYLAIFSRANSMLEPCGIYAGDPKDSQTARHFNSCYLAARRRENYNCLRQFLGDYLLFDELPNTFVPLFVPLLLPDDVDKNTVRSNLACKRIYCPSHWPRDHRIPMLDSNSEFLYEREVSVPCDQRYGIEEMTWLGEALLKTIQENRGSGIVRLSQE